MQAERVHRQVHDRAEPSDDREPHELAHQPRPGRCGVVLDHVHVLPVSRAGTPAPAPARRRSGAFSPRRHGAPRPVRGYGPAVTDDGGVQVDLVRLGPASLRALADGDLATAEASAPVPLSPYLAGPECRWVWSVRAEQVVADPRSAGWITGVVWDPRHRLAVGRAGFHGPPDEVGMVEVGYSIDPLHRRRGYARAAVRALLEEAAAAPEVTVVRASVGPRQRGLARAGPLARFRGGGGADRRAGRAGDRARAAAGPPLTPRRPGAALPWPLVLVLALDTATPTLVAGLARLVARRRRGAGRAGRALGHGTPSC